SAPPRLCVKKKSAGVIEVGPPGKTRRTYRTSEAPHLMQRHRDAEARQFGVSQRLRVSASTKDPQVSLKLPLQGPFVRQSQGRDFPTAQRDAALANFNT